MNLKVIGEGCDRCDALFENTIEAVTQLGLDAEIEKVSDLIDCQARCDDRPLPDGGRQADCQRAGGICRKNYEAA